MSPTKKNEDSSEKKAPIDTNLLKEMLGSFGVSSEEEEEYEEPKGVVFDTPDVEESLKEEETKESTPDTAKPEEKSQYSPIDIQNAVLHLIKPKNIWKKEYIIAKEFTVWMSPPNDKQDSELNDYSLKVLARGDKRTRTDVVDSYTDPKTQTFIPGGRTETEYFYNPDAPRALKRAETACYLVTLNGEDVSSLSLTAKIKKLEEEYNPIILEAIYQKALVPFLGLMAEAKKEILNF